MKRKCERWKSQNCFDYYTREVRWRIITTVVRQPVCCCGHFETMKNLNTCTKANECSKNDIHSVSDTHTFLWWKKYIYIIKSIFKHENQFYQVHTNIFNLLSNSSLFHARKAHRNIQYELWRSFCERISFRVKVIMSQVIY